MQRTKGSGEWDGKLSRAFVQKIRELLIARQWSQREFARRVGVTQAAVSYLLARKRRASDLDYYQQFARAFEMPLSALIADLEQIAHENTTTQKGQFE